MYNKEAFVDNHPCYGLFRRSSFFALDETIASGAVLSSYPGRTGEQTDGWADGRKRFRSQLNNSEMVRDRLHVYVSMWS